MKTNDADWVEDVRRWYFNGNRSGAATAPTPMTRATEIEPTDIGYEAAHPSLQSSGWATPAPSGFGSLP